jgi:hypothetical protein
VQIQILGEDVREGPLSCLRALGIPPGFAARRDEIAVRLAQLSVQPAVAGQLDRPVQMLRRRAPVVQELRAAERLQGGDQARGVAELFGQFDAAPGQSARLGQRQSRSVFRRSKSALPPQMIGEMSRNGPSGRGV